MIKSILHISVGFGSERQVSLYRCLIAAIKVCKYDNAVQKTIPEGLAHSRIKIHDSWPAKYNVQIHHQ